MTSSDSDTTATKEEYKYREITSLPELQPGDHIKVTEREKSPPRRWHLFGRFSSSSSSSSGKPGCSYESMCGDHHMLVVKTNSAGKVHVIHKTMGGVREEAMALNAKDVKVIDYKCKFTGKEAIKNARRCHGDEYDPANSNDEHFVTKAKTGHAFSNTHGSGKTDVPKGRVEYSLRYIQCLHELNPGDHIRVKGSMRLPDMIRGVSRPSNTPKKWSAYTHHMLVVKAINSSRVTIIHKTEDGVVVETNEYEPKDITVLDYESQYNGEEAIARAREIHGEPYKVLTSNCEHFVTEARTGEKCCGQIEGVVVGVAIGGLAGAPVGVVGGIGAGAAVGAGVGGVLFAGIGALPGAVAGAVVGGAVGLLGVGGLSVAGGGVGGLRRANRTIQPPNGN